MSADAPTASVGVTSAAGPTQGANTPDGVFLIHGLGGTQYDLGSMHKRLPQSLSEEKAREVRSIGPPT